MMARRDACAAIAWISQAAAAPIYTVTPLVTDDQDALAANGFGPAATVDPNLINPWGISLGATTPFWVSNQGTNTSTVYDGEGTARCQHPARRTAGGADRAGIRG